MDLTKIKEAQARETERHNGSYPRKHVLGGEQDRALLLAAVPDLLAEIERLKIDRKRMRDLVAAAREDIDADRIATAYAALGAL